MPYHLAHCQVTKPSTQLILKGLGEAGIAQDYLGTYLNWLSFTGT